MENEDHLEQRGQEARIHGIGPYKSIDVEKYRGQHIPNNWEIEGVTGDVLLCSYADEAEGENMDGIVDRGGIFVDSSVTNEIWRVARIVFAGPGASEQAAVGSCILFPSDKGIPMTKFDGKNFIFINEERILAFVKPRSEGKDTMV